MSDPNNSTRFLGFSYSNSRAAVPITAEGSEKLTRSLPQMGKPIVSIVSTETANGPVAATVDYLMIGNQPFHMRTGAILLAAPSRKGKTTLLTAWALTCMQHGIATEFLSVGEPGSPGGFESLKDFETRLASVAQQVRGGVVFVDSITFAVYTLSAVNQLQTSKAGTLPGGIDLVHTMSMVFLDSFARQNDVLIIASVNADYFPAVDKFDGVVSGYASITDYGRMNINTRWAGRKDTTYVFDNDILTDARYLVQGPDFSAPSTPLGYWQVDPSSNFTAAGGLHTIVNDPFNPWQR